MQRLLITASVLGFLTGPALTYQSDAVVDAFAKAAGSIVSDDDLRGFAEFVIYTSVCDVDESIIEPPTWVVVNKIIEQRSEERRLAIGRGANENVTGLIARLGALKFCATYSALATPRIKRLNESTRSLAGHVW
jgi:hypothetical protein